MTSYSQPSGSDDKIDILIDQVGRLTEVVMMGFQDMRAEFRDMRTELAEIKEITRQQAETAKQQAEVAKQQAEVAKQQAEGIAKLAGIVESLLQRESSRPGSGQGN